jgi:hypothetical protein
MAVRGDRLVEEMTPIATFLGVVASIGAVGAYYSSRLAALEERMVGVMKEVDAKVSGAKDEVKATMAGTASKLEERVAGTASKLEERVAGSASKLEERVAGIEKAADLKVRPSPCLEKPQIYALPLLTRAPFSPSLSCSTGPSDQLVAACCTTSVIVCCEKIQV